MMTSPFFVWMLIQSIQVLLATTTPECSGADTMWIVDQSSIVRDGAGTWQSMLTLINGISKYGSITNSRQGYSLFSGPLAFFPEAYDTVGETVSFESNIDLPNTVLTLSAEGGSRDFAGIFSFLKNSVFTEASRSGRKRLCFLVTFGDPTGDLGQDVSPSSAESMATSLMSENGVEVIFIKIGTPAYFLTSTATQSFLVDPANIPEAINRISQVLPEYYTCRTNSPTRLPTSSPSKAQTKVPSKLPSKSPTNRPTKLPTVLPTKFPTKLPTLLPTKLPTKLPTLLPTKQPTLLPTSKTPTSAPSDPPTPFEILYLENNVDAGVTPLTAAQKAVVQQAIERWQTVFLRDYPSTFLAPQGEFCKYIFPQDKVVKNILMIIAIKAIDGPGKTFASAAPCAIDESGYPRMGVITVDLADVDYLTSSNLLFNIVVHEIGHVFGIGTLWQNFNLLQINPPELPLYIGAQGNEQNAAVGGPSAGAVAEDLYGTSTALRHWKESIYKTELMTGISSPAGTAMPLSKLTLGALADLGFSIDFSKADEYTVPTTPSPSSSRRLRKQNPQVDENVILFDGDVEDLEPIMVTTVAKPGREKEFMKTKKKNAERTRKP